MHISPSQLDQFSCRLAWSWGQQYKPVTAKEALEFGTGIHLALQAYYADQRDPAQVFKKWADKRLCRLKALWKDEIDSMRVTAELGVAMLEGYVKEYADVEKFKVLATEQELRCKLPGMVVPTKTGEKFIAPNCDVLVRVDALVQDMKTKGNIYVLEHKTFETFHAAQLFRDHQFCAEVFCAQDLKRNLDIDRPITGLIYNGLRKAFPGKTKSNLFERHYININQYQIEQFLVRTFDMYRIIKSRGFLIYPQPNVVRCSMCAFKEACIEYMKGGDYQFTLDMFFEPRRKEEDKKKGDK